MKNRKLWYILFTMMLIEGMGHDHPHGGAWPQILDAITVFTAKVPA